MEASLNKVRISDTTLFKKDWFYFVVTFVGAIVFFLVFAGYRFLDGDDALQAIWALAKQHGINPWLFPLHGISSRFGTFVLIYIFSFIFKSPLLSFSILSAVSAALVIATLLLYTNALLNTKARFAHLPLLLAVMPEVVYAGLRCNAAVLGYAAGFLAIYLNIWLIRNDKSRFFFLFSGALFGLSMALCMSSAFLAVAFPMQHLFLKQQKGARRVAENFFYEVLAGVLVYVLFLLAMHMSPLAPLREYARVADVYKGAGLLYLAVTLAGAINPWTVFLLPVGLVIMFKKKEFLPISLGLLIVIICGLAFKDIFKTFQHTLAMYLIVCVCAVSIWEALKKPWLRFGYAFLLVLPLFIGLAADLPEQPYRGPGFSEIDTGQALTPGEKDARGLGGFKIWRGPKIIIHGHGLQPTLGSGFMLATVTGGRGLGGHFWVWVFDWKKYLKDTNRSMEIIRDRPEQDILMGQYAVTAHTLYELVDDGYVLHHFEHNEYWFVKNGRIKKIYIYFNQLREQAKQNAINFGPFAGKFDHGLFVAFPSFTYRMEQRKLAIQGYSFKSMGYFCFEINSIKP